MCLLCNELQKEKITMSAKQFLLNYKETVDESDEAHLDEMYKIFSTKVPTEFVDAIANEILTGDYND